VKEVNRYGAFLDWGLSKDLFVPYSEQRFEMKKGEKYIVYLYKDRIKHRVVATTKIEKHLVRDQRPPFYNGEEVDLLIYEFTPLGAKVVVENRFYGLIYHSELFQDLKIGDHTTGFIQQVREDDKLDITLRQSGRQGAEDAKEILLAKLRENDHFLPLNDDSSPEMIKECLQMSKNAFKKAVGGLYKAQVIEITEEGISLKKEVQEV
jgi:predicted RNA-binding protein (virulence factor B family)